MFCVTVQRIERRRVIGTSGHLYAIRGSLGVRCAPERSTSCLGFKSEWYLVETPNGKKVLKGSSDRVSVRAI
jgi:hypothetical protein